MIRGNQESMGEKTHTSFQVLLPLGMATALSLMGDATMYTVLPTHTEEAGIALTLVGILLGINRGVRILFNNLAGIGYDKWPRRSLLIPAYFIGSGSTFLYALSHGFWLLLFARILWGLAWSGIWVGGVSVILDIAGERNRGRLMGFYQVWFFVGIALGSFLGGLLTDTVGYRTTMVVGGAVTALGGVFALLFLPETSSRRQTATVKNQSPGHLKSGNESTRTYRATAWIAALLMGIDRFIIAGILSATMSLLVREKISPYAVFVGVSTLTGIMVAARTVLSMASAPLIGIVSDSLRDRWRVVMMALLAGAIGMLLIAHGSPLSLFFGIAVAAMTNGGMQVLVRSLVGDVASQSRYGRTVGLLHTTGDIGSALGPPLAFLVLPFIGLSGLFLSAGVLYALSFGFLIFLRFRAVLTLRN